MCLFIVARLESYLAVSRSSFDGRYPSVAIVKEIPFSWVLTSDKVNKVLQNTEVEYGPGSLRRRGYISNLDTSYLRRACGSSAALNSTE